MRAMRITARITAAKATNPSTAAILPLQGQQVVDEGVAFGVET